MISTLFVIFVLCLIFSGGTKVDLYNKIDLGFKSLMLPLLKNILYFKPYLDVDNVIKQLYMYRQSIFKRF